MLSQGDKIRGKWKQKFWPIWRMVPIGRLHHYFHILYDLPYAFRTDAFFLTDSLYGWRFPLPYCDQKMANVAGVTAIQDSGTGKSTIRLVKHTAM